MPANKAKTLKPTSDAVSVLHHRFYEGKPARLKNLEEARANEEIARKNPGTEGSGDPHPNSTCQASRHDRIGHLPLRGCRLRGPLPGECCAGLRAR
jgi:hypothetical protein